MYGRLVGLLGQGSAQRKASVIFNNAISALDVASWKGGHEWCEGKGLEISCHGLFESITHDLQTETREPQLG
jgi:hypothetical protein